MTDYLRALDGRIRIKIAAVKGSPATAAEVTEYLLGSPGIVEVSANPITGNVLVLYDISHISHGRILHLLTEAGYLRKTASVPATRQDGLVPVPARAVMETALQ